MPDGTLESLNTLLLPAAPGSLRSTVSAAGARPNRDRIVTSIWLSGQVPPLDPKRRWEIEQHLAVAARRDVDRLSMIIAS